MPGEPKTTLVVGTAVVPSRRAVEARGGRHSGKVGRVVGISKKEGWPVVTWGAARQRWITRPDMIEPHHAD